LSEYLSPFTADLIGVVVSFLAMAALMQRRLDTGALDTGAAE